MAGDFGEHPTKWGEENGGLDLPQKCWKAKKVYICSITFLTYFTSYLFLLKSFFLEFSCKMKSFNFYQFYV